MMPAESLADLFKQQDKLTMDLTETIVVTEKHAKRSKRVRVVKLDPETRCVLQKYMTASRKIFNIALDLHNKGFRGKEIRKRCARSKFVPETLKTVPEHVRQKAYDKFCSSKSSSEEQGGSLTFISRNKDEAWVGLQKRDCNIKNPTFFHFVWKLSVGLNDKLDDHLQRDIEITERFGIFYATITENRVFLRATPVDIKTLRV